MTFTSHNMKMNMLYTSMLASYVNLGMHMHIELRGRYVVIK